MKTKLIYSNINYHVVFCPRFRRQIFKNLELRTRFKEIATNTCNVNDITLNKVEFGMDYVLLNITALPNHTPTKIIRVIKESTGNILISEFEELRHMQNLWTNNFLIKTEQITTDELTSFVASQKKNSRRDKYE